MPVGRQLWNSTPAGPSGDASHGCSMVANLRPAASMVPSVPTSGCGCEASLVNVINIGIPLRLIRVLCARYLNGDCYAHMYLVGLLGFV